jgi:head-tail adaptor
MAVDPTQLTWMRAKAAELLLTDLCAIQRKTLADDGRGGQTGSWANVTDNVRCRVAPFRLIAGEATKENRTVSIGPYSIEFAQGTDIRNGDRIKVHTLGERVFNILGARWGSLEILRIMAADEVV